MNELVAAQLLVGELVKCASEPEYASLAHRGSRGSRGCRGIFKEGAVLYELSWVWFVLGWSGSVRDGFG